MNTGISPNISALPSVSPRPVIPHLHDDIILAGGAKRSFYSPNPKPPTSNWSDFRNRHLYQMQQKTRIQRNNNFGLTTSDETTSPSSSTSEGEGSIAETELMIHHDSVVENRHIANNPMKPQKPPRLTHYRNDMGNSRTTFETFDPSKSYSSKSSSSEIIPAPPPPPMPPIKVFIKNTRHTGHLTGITETLQNRMANAAVSAASEARARKVSKL
jgi:hypothetical protein